MALTSEDLGQITSIIEQAVAPLATIAELDSKLSKLESNFDTKLNSATAGLATKADLDRMESRLTISMNLLERDTFSRLDQHEVRIARLEQARP